MREMKDVWKELKRRGEGDEDEPLSRGPASKKGGPTGPAPAAYKATGGAADEEADYFDTGFTLREVGPQAVRAWLALQAGALCFQLLLWNEVSGHLSEFEDVVSTECAPGRLRHGVCVGPRWNLSSWQDTVLSAAGPHAHSFEFQTASLPPTFLIVVDPVSWVKADGSALPDAAPRDLGEQERDVRDARWSLEVVRTSPPQVAPALRRFHAGQDAITFEDLSAEARDAVTASGRVRWRATLAARGVARRKTRYVAFVEDAATSQLDEVRANPQCAFGRSWKAFNQQHQGHSHRALSWCRFLLGVFLLVGGGAVYAVNAQLASGPLGYRFHLWVAAKFLLQDVPQQICIVLYLLGWYEAAGLRCQLCLFRPQHCGVEHPFHFANSIAFGCTLLSSVANQLLIRPTFKRVYTEDDICVHYSVRIGGLCVSVLPFTTGLCWASRSLLPAPGLLHLVAAVPCGIGWMTLGGLICVPVMSCCDEDCDDF